MRRLALLAVVLAAGAGSPSAGANEHLHLLGLIDRHEAGRREISQFHLLASQDRARALQGVARRSRAALRALDWNALSTDARIDALLFEAQLDREADAAGDAARYLKLMPRVAPFHETLLGLLQLDRQHRGAWPHRQLARSLENLAQMADRLKAELASRIDGLDPSGPLADAGMARWAVAQVEAGRGYLKTWYETHQGTEPGFRWWLEKPYKRASAALAAYAAALQKQWMAKLRSLSRPAFAIGEKAFARSLRLHFMPQTPRSLLALGQRQMKAVLADLARTARKVDPGSAGWKAALATVKEDHVPAGGQREYVRQVSEEAIRFCREKQLYHIPTACSDMWYLTPISAKDQKRFPFAFYSGLRMGVAFARAAMPHGDKLAAMAGNNRHFTRNVVPHELIPGHHLQFHYAARHRTWRRRFSTPFLVEGHGFYTELLFDEQGFFRTPAERMGHLFWKLLRAARIVVSTRYHLGEMSQAQMVAFMQDRVGLERQGAQAEVDRYMTYHPLYQAAYMAGGLQHVALREACRTAWGQKFSLIRFHRELLEQNSIPLRLSRYALLGLTVPRDARAATARSEEE